MGPTTGLIRHRAWLALLLLAVAVLGAPPSSGGGVLAARASADDGPSPVSRQETGLLSQPRANVGMTVVGDGMLFHGGRTDGGPSTAVDIFDAGPTVEAFIDHIDTVREAVRMSAAEFSGGDLRAPAGLIARASVTDFAVTQYTRGEDPAAVLKRIGAAGHDEVLVYRLKEKRA